jgi:hypothetical protein
MVSKKTHILILSAALSAVTMAGGVAAVELAARPPSVHSTPVPAYVAAATHAAAPVAYEQEAGDGS